MIKNKIIPLDERTLILTLAVVELAAFVATQSYRPVSVISSELKTKFVPERKM